MPEPKTLSEVEAANKLMRLVRAILRSIRHPELVSGPISPLAPAVRERTMDAETSSAWRVGLGMSDTATQSEAANKQARKPIGCRGRR